MTDATPTWFKPERNLSEYARVAGALGFDQRPRCVGERPTCPDCSECSLNTPLVRPRQ